jgi:hypothetical protein
MESLGFSDFLKIVLYFLYRYAAFRISTGIRIPDPLAMKHTNITNNKLYLFFSFFGRNRNRFSKIIVIIWLSFSLA